MTRTTNQNSTDITDIFPFVIKTEEQYNKALSIRHLQKPETFTVTKLHRK
jgi:hypothetical protein